MKLTKKAGATSEIWQVFIRDSSSTTGAGLTGLTNASSGLTAYYHRDTDTTATAISLVSMTVGTFTSSGFKEIDATNMPGWYQFCPPNAALASGAKSCGFHLKGATNMAPLPIEVQLVAYDPDDSVRQGMTALPNAAAEAAGGLFTRGTGAGQVRQDANGRLDVNVKAYGDSAGTFASGRPEVNTTHAAGTAWGSGAITAGSIAAGALNGKGDWLLSSSYTTPPTTAAIASAVLSHDTVGYTTSQIGGLIQRTCDNSQRLYDMTEVSGTDPQFKASALFLVNTQVWGGGARTLTSIGTSECPALANLDAAVTSRVGLSDVNIGPTGVIEANVVEVAGVDVEPSAAVDANVVTIDAAAAAAILAAGDVDGFTLEETLKVCLAALAGKASGAGTTTIAFRAADDSKNRITATVDSSGNRTSLILDVSG